MNSVNIYYQQDRLKFKWAVRRWSLSYISLYEKVRKVTGLKIHLIHDTFRKVIPDKIYEILKDNYNYVNVS
jgi:hypothetical protein